MTVKELILKLSQFNENLKVHVSVGSGYELYSQEVEEVDFNEFENAISIN